MARCLAGWVASLFAVGCADGGSPAIRATGKPGVRLEGLRFFEERDDRLALDLRARSARVDPAGRRAAFVDIEAHFELPDLGAVTLRAERGELREERLDVQGRVRLTDTRGRTLDADRAVYDSTRRALAVPGTAHARADRWRARGGRALLDLGAQRLEISGGVEMEVRP